VLPTDTQKNTVYAFTQRLGDVEPEVLALALAGHFVKAPITRARVTVDQYGWTRLAPHSFARGDAENSARAPWCTTATPVPSSRAAYATSS